VPKRCRIWAPGTRRKREIIRDGACVGHRTKGPELGSGPGDFQQSRTAMGSSDPAWSSSRCPGVPLAASQCPLQVALPAASFSHPFPSRGR
jgi:hypothetical protein